MQTRCHLVREQAANAPTVLVKFPLLNKHEVVEMWVFHPVMRDAEVTVPRVEIAQGVELPPPELQWVLMRRQVNLRNHGHGLLRQRSVGGSVAIIDAHIPTAGARWRTRAGGGDVRRQGTNSRSEGSRVRRGRRRCHSQGHRGCDSTIRRQPRHPRLLRAHPRIATFSRGGYASRRRSILIFLHRFFTRSVVRLLFNIVLSASCASYLECFGASVHCTFCTRSSSSPLALHFPSFFIHRGASFIFTGLYRRALPSLSLRCGYLLINTFMLCPRERLFFCAARNRRS
mmetsp:Transcript_7410/g.21838  ORF Transcript_7410/g.21838 Transcript_7410/m.21838 type:complete len:286 (+) Transcript_7410:2876-3733(+)